MGNALSDFERFGAYVCERRDWSVCRENFNAYCHRTGSDQERLDSMLLEELGMSGEEVMESLRKGNVCIE